MKVLKIDNRAFALEPHDRIAALNIDRLRDDGISETAIDIYRRYRFGLFGSAPSTEDERVSTAEAATSSNSAKAL
jgi:hypothetical protein